MWEWYWSFHLILLQKAYFTKCWTMSLINKVSALASCSRVTVSMLSMQRWVMIQIWLSSINFFPCEIVKSQVYHRTSPQQNENNKLQTCRLYSTSSDKDTECVYKGLIKDDSSFLFMNHGIFPSNCVFTAHQTVFKSSCISASHNWLLHFDNMQAYMPGQVG